MLPDFLVEEITVRESGQSAVFDLTDYSRQSLLVTFGITHAVEKEIIEIDIYESEDAAAWPEKPLVSFTPKSYCGIYELTTPYCGKRFLKAVWSAMEMVATTDAPPFFSASLFPCGRRV